MKKSIVLAMGLAAPLMMASQAHAGFVMEDWTFNFSSVAPGALDPATVNNIDAMGFNDAPIKTELKTDNGDGVISAGDIFRVQGKGSIGQLLDNVNGNSSPLGLGTEFEMTFVFDLEVKITGADSDGFSWTHLAGDDVLKLYIDGADDGFGNGFATKANPGTGSGYDDGTLVAIFDVVAGEGGAFVFDSLDGSDDAIFALSDLMTPGIIVDKDGNDLQVGETLALSDSNFDADSDHNGDLDFTGGGFGCTLSNQNFASFCGQEDGTIRFSVPEPTTLALFGLGLIFAPLGMRRKASHRLCAA